MSSALQQKKQQQVSLLLNNHRWQMSKSKWAQSACCVRFE
jgi:hypothetical protein